MNKEKSQAALLKEKLFYKTKSGILDASEQTLKAASEFCDGYKSFLNVAKTERLAVKEAISLAKQHGFTEFLQGKKYVAGDKVYLNNRKKAVAFAVIGKEPIKNGIRIAAAHVDSPRLDLKPNPLYEDGDLALFKTHYYGGIRKYQWPAIPLTLHGVVVKRDGTAIDIAIGDLDSDPCFVVTDLLPHLAVDQSKRLLSDGIRGEELNILVGSHPFSDTAEGELVKLNIMKIINEKYGIVEEDFISAELECVPSFMARDIGFDRSMIGSYGHDDRVCAYPELMAIIGATMPNKTAVAILADKEEVGSDGNTGLNSTFLQYFIEDLAETQGVSGHRVLMKSECLSADVNAAFDPTFPDVFERKNAAMLNRGAVITKYTGSRGKGDTSDASAEFVGKIRNMLCDAGIVWQTGELGKVDAGGGGTVAKYIANLGVDVVDLGVPVLSMHSPFEVVAKFDVYMTYLTIVEFFK